MENFVVTLFIVYLIYSIIKSSKIDIQIHKEKSGSRTHNPQQAKIYEKYLIQMIILLFALYLPKDVLPNVTNFFQNTLV